MAHPEHYEIKNWKTFQHYKDRNPPWIKLHVQIFASEDWVTLADASRLLAVVCMVIAAKNDGKVPNNPDYIKRVAYLDKRPDLTPLINCGFLINPQADASESKQEQAKSRPETEAYRTDSEKKDISDERVSYPEKFEALWKAYPSRGKAANPKKVAFKAWEKLTRADANPDLMIARAPLAAPTEKHGTEFVPQLATWLNQERFLDEPPAAPVANADDMPKRTFSDENWRVALSTFEKTGKWPSIFGPEPGSIGCECPEHLLRRTAAA